MRPYSILKRVGFVVAFALWLGLCSANAADSPIRVLAKKAQFNVPESQMTWGLTTNFTRGDISAEAAFPAAIKAGIRSPNHAIVLSGNLLRPAPPVSVYLESVSGSGGVATNFDPTNRIWTFVPPTNERMAVSMFTANGDPVPKSTQGLSLGKPPTLDRSAVNFKWDKYGCQCAVLLPDRDCEIYSLDPAAFFDVTAIGRYKLVLVPRIYIIDTNANLKPVELPAVTINVVIEKGGQ